MGRLEKLKTPPCVVLVVLEVPRSVSLAVTVASGRAAPAESSTVPVIEAVICCAHAEKRTPDVHRAITRAAPHKEDLFITASKTTMSNGALLTGTISQLLDWLLL